MTARRLSQFLALSLAACTFWVIISRPGVVEPGFALAIYVAFAVVTAAVFGLCFLALRVGTGGSTNYWWMENADQVRLVSVMICTVLGALLAMELVFNWLGRAGPASAHITYLLAGTLIPAAFLQLGLITWPSRLGRPGRLKLVLFSVGGIGLATVWAYAAWSSAPDQPDLSAHDLLVTMGAVMVGATLEEVMFRVLLLTALLDRIGSLFQAVFLSSVAFGLMHVPGALVDPVMHGDWAFVQQVALEYAPLFLLQTSGGLFLGVLWLQSGSITLIALTHAVFNMGKALAYGLLA